MASLGLQPFGEIPKDKEGQIKEGWAQSILDLTEKERTKTTTSETKGKLSKMTKQILFNEMLEWREAYSYIYKCIKQGSTDRKGHFLLGSKTSISLNPPRRRTAPSYGNEDEHKKCEYGLI